MDLHNISPVMWTIAAIIALIILIAIIVVVGLKRKKANTISFEKKEEPEAKTQKELSGNYQAKSEFSFAPATPKKAEPVLREGQKLPGAQAQDVPPTPPAPQPEPKLQAQPAQPQPEPKAAAAKPAPTPEPAPAKPVEPVAPNSPTVTAEPEKPAAAASDKNPVVAAEEPSAQKAASEPATAADAPQGTDLVGMPPADSATTLAEQVNAKSAEPVTPPAPQAAQVEPENKAPGSSAAHRAAAAAGAAAVGAAAVGAAKAEAQSVQDEPERQQPQQEKVPAAAPEEDAPTVEETPEAAQAAVADEPSSEESVEDSTAIAPAEDAREAGLEETDLEEVADSEQVPAEDAASDAVAQDGDDVLASDTPAEADAPQPAAEETLHAEAEEAAVAADRSIDAAAQARETTPAPEQQAPAAPATQVDDIDPAEGRLGRLRGRLSRSQNVIGQGVLGILSAGDLDEDAWEEIEDTLLMADLGTATTVKVVDALREKIAARGVSSEAEARAMLRETLIEAAKPDLDRSIRAMPYEGKPAVILVVGVNGTGKTTTTGKLARVLVSMGHKVILGAADTFRAAAADQLETWGRRVGAETVRGAEGADPASVAFDAVARGVEQGVDVVVVDTAGRLHTSVGLMDQLGKVKRVVEKKAQVDEVLLVLDATVGQNGLIQARTFRDVVDITGVVLTKLDGTAKGGIVFQVQEELGVPVKLVGLGEGADHLAPFEVDSFVDALLGTAS